MICRSIGNGSCKTQLLVSPKTKEVVLVDPLLEKTADYLDLLRKEGLKLACAIDTHTHADHLSGGLDLREKTGAAYIMHAASRSNCVSRRVEDAETVGVGDISVKFLHTPGHTRDSVSLLLGDRLLSGDFLFIGSYGAGRLDLPGSDPAIHFDSLKKLDSLPDSLLLLPAHDYQGLEQSTLGAERKANPVLTPRGREEYLKWWAAKTFGPSDWMKEVVAANLQGARDPRAVLIPKENAACACAAAPAVGAPQPQISAADLARNLERAPGSVVLLDVRTHEEYNDELGHIAGTVLIPVDELSARVREVPPGEVVVICRSGKRAARAAAMLSEAGRDKLWVMTGGMIAWNEAHLPTA
jgi:glyoxylase-like metal-dependent hydrolase (beta-lactamase superfamily II)/rhodanese-related sulfurtransferase